MSMRVEMPKDMFGELGRLDHLSKRVVKAALGEMARLAYGKSMRLLSGPGGKFAYRTSTSGRKYRVKRKTPVPAGLYPVNVRTGHLRRNMYTVMPGRSYGAAAMSSLRTRKPVPAVSVKAGPFEAVLGNAAAYSHVIHDGTGTSSKHGPRRYGTDAVASINPEAILERALEGIR